MRPVLLVFLWVCLFVPSANADPYQEFSLKLYDYHKATVELLPEILGSTMKIASFLQGAHDYSSIENIGGELARKFDNFSNKSKVLREYYKQQPNALSAAKGILDDMKREMSDEQIKKIGEYAKYFNSFSKDSKRTQFTVYANEGWANTGVQVQEGDIVFINSAGEWSVSPNTYGFVDWRGHYNGNSRVYTLNQSAPLGALLYRVRGSSNSIGAGFDNQKAGRVDAGGRLEMTINDSALGNNKGQLDVDMLIVDGEIFEGFINAIEAFRNRE